MLVSPNEFSSSHTRRAFVMRMVLLEVRIGNGGLPKLSIAEGRLPIAEICLNIFIAHQ
jgi:hypothetical protein